MGTEVEPRVFENFEEVKLGELFKCVESAVPLIYTIGSVYVAMKNPWSGSIALSDNLGGCCRTTSSLFVRVTYEDMTAGELEEEDLSQEAVEAEGEPFLGLKVGDYVTWGSRNVAYLVTQVFPDFAEFDYSKGFGLNYEFDPSEGTGVLDAGDGPIYLYDVDTGKQTQAGVEPVVVEPVYDPAAYSTTFTPVISKGTSDGGPSAYYDFPEGCITLNDLIEHANMTFAQGNIFKAAYRLGNKDGISREYDLQKIKYYADRMLNQLAKEATTPF